MSYIVMPLVGLIFLLASFAVWSPALAQDPTGPLDFGGCDDFEDAKPAASELAAAVKCLTDRLVQLEDEIEPYRRAQGAVIAFDRDRTKEQVCPKGWTYFSPAGGRFIVGAGEHDNGLTEYPSYIEDNKQAVGGEEKHMLTSEELPSHSHPLDTLQYIARDAGGAEERYQAVIEPKKGYEGYHVMTPTGNMGGGEPHNNMPPFVALYLCKKD